VAEAVKGGFRFHNQESSHFSDYRASLREAPQARTAPKRFGG
jgi:hypothetical protein